MSTRDAVVDETIVGVLSDDVVTNEQLAQLTPQLTLAERVEGVNRLLLAGRVEVVGGPTGGAFSLRIRRGLQLPTGATAEEQLVFSLIEDSQRMGIWIRDIRDRSGLSQAQMRKALKGLEQRKWVKAIKAVSSTKKCYMLFGLEPDESVSGGAFYSDQQLDAQFVQTLVHLCVSFLRGKSADAELAFPLDPIAQRHAASVTSTVVGEYVRDRGVSRVALAVADIEAALEVPLHPRTNPAIAQVAVLDGAVERRGNGLYRFRHRDARPTALASLPCLHCSLVDDCRAGNSISPASCLYFTDWLENSK